MQSEWGVENQRKAIDKQFCMWLWRVRIVPQYDNKLWQVQRCLMQRWQLSWHYGPRTRPLLLLPDSPWAGGHLQL